MHLLIVPLADYYIDTLLLVLPKFKSKYVEHFAKHKLLSFMLLIKSMYLFNDRQ